MAGGCQSGLRSRRYHPPSGSVATPPAAAVAAVAAAVHATVISFIATPIKMHLPAAQGTAAQPESNGNQKVTGPGAGDVPCAVIIWLRRLEPTRGDAP